MRRSLVLAGFSAGASLILVGCSAQQDGASAQPGVEEKKPATTAVAAIQVKPEKEAFIFRAKYYRTKGPCVRMGDALAMPVVDAFTVTEVLEGELKARDITVRAFTGGGPGYPKELREEEVYTLRLTPSERTRQQLRENEKELPSHLVVDGEELEELQSAR
jgi:hypothetical protein